MGTRGVTGFDHFFGFSGCITYYFFRGGIPTGDKAQIVVLKVF
jgi:hypothetical protein